MKAQNTVRKYGVNQVFRFVEGILLHRKSRQIRNFCRKRPIFLHTCATCSELPSYISAMGNILQHSDPKIISSVAASITRYDCPSVTVYIQLC